MLNRILTPALVVLLLFVNARVWADEQTPTVPMDKPFAPPPGARQLDPRYPVWLDAARHQVIMDGQVCLREGALEMFICLQGTKEHESILAVKTKAFLVHAALLAAGAKPGKPVQYDPKYVAATGTEIDITLQWLAKDGKQKTARAQEWIRNAQTGKAMTDHWVFAGSGFWVDENDGTKHYHAESGDFICVSNFSTAMLDLPIESTQTNQGLLFEALTERIPPEGTTVRIVLAPRLQPVDQTPPTQP